MKASKAEALNQALTEGLSRDPGLARVLDHQPAKRSWAGRGQRGHVRREGNAWVLHFRAPSDDEDGKRPRRRQVLGAVDEIGDYAAARAAGDRFMQQTIPSRLPAGASLKWEAYCERYLTIVVARLGPGTQAAHRCVVSRHLAKAFAGMHLHEIDVRGVQRFIDAQTAAGVKPTTVRARFSVLRKMLRAAAKEGLAATAPPPFLIDFPVDTRVERSGVERAPSEELIAKLLAAVNGPLRIQVLLALLIGLRSGEIFGLQWTHIHLDEDPPRLDVRQQAPRREVRTTKTRASLRSITMPPDLVAALREYREAWRPNADGFLFPGRDGQPVCSSGARSRHLRPLMQSLGMPGSFHSLRHAFGVRLGVSGAGLATIKDAMRLGSLRAAEVYVRARREDTALAIRAASLVRFPRQT